MSDDIIVEGIETNNLKDIDVLIKKNAINLIIGPSGSGKSSLAYDTIAQIGQYEFLSMFADNIIEPSYKVKAFYNMSPAVPIKQSNFNNNLRSTIGTYFGLNRSIGLIYASILGLNEDFFVLNKENNLCEHCHGLGFVSILDANKIIDYNLPLEKNPFRCWNRYKDFYTQIIKMYCNDNEIDSKKTFRELSEKEKQLILYGESKDKYSIKYKKTGAYSRRTTKYYGVMTGIPMIVNFSYSKKFFSERECECCKGKKYSSVYDKYKIRGLSIGEFMTMPFEKLSSITSKIVLDEHNSRLKFALKNINDFINKSKELSLGHLFFHRSIPTLSGGELQRLRMVKIFNSQLRDLIIVLDEPLGGLSGSEKQIVYKNILNLSKNHTLVIVDHSDVFVKKAKNIIALGKKGGNKGGFVIDSMKYLEEQNIEKDFKVPKPKQDILIKINTSIYKYKGVDISIAKNCMNLITGYSGVGKSTLLREYLSQYFEQYIYINQRPLLGNKNSYVATVLNIFGNISDMFAKKFSKDRRFFSNLTGNEGMCPICRGAGYIEYGSNDHSKIKLQCNKCDGTGFNENLKKYKISGKNILDIWKMTIDEACDYFEVLDSKVHSILINASSIMLGHLRIGQSTETLSGGENIRVKILKSAKSTSKVFGIDEPFKGLSNYEIYCVATFLDNIRKQGKTIIVADHVDKASRYFSKKIILSNDDRIIIGRENKK